MNKTSWIILGISGGVALIIIVFLLGPGLLTDWRTYQDTQTAKKELSDLTQEKNLLGKLAKNPDLDKITTAATNYIPEEAKSSELILEISAIAGQSSMSVDGISLDSNTTAPAPDETVTTTKSNTSTTTTQNTNKNTSTLTPVSFDLKISGTFGNLMQFFKLTETSSRLISIKGLSLKQDADKFSADIIGEAYFAKTTPVEKTITNITVTADTLAKFANLHQYSAPVNTSTEAGFGRANPFANP